VLTQGITQPDFKKMNYIFGVGGYYKGFELFAAVDVKNEGFRLAASICPERREELIEVKSIELTANPIYPHRMRQRLAVLLEHVTVENKIANPVKLTISLKHRNLPGLTSAAVTGKLSTSSISLPIPSGLLEVKAGSYTYSVEILAYFRGRQIINLSLPFEIEDEHDWNGDASMLHGAIADKAEEIKSQNYWSLEINGALALFDQGYIAGFIIKWNKLLHAFSNIKSAKGEQALAEAYKIMNMPARLKEMNKSGRQN